MKKFIFVLCLSLMSMTFINASNETNDSSDEIEKNSTVVAHVVISSWGGQEVYFKTLKCALDYAEMFPGSEYTGVKRVRSTQAIVCL